METPLISILVPIFNAQKTLRKCLDSLVNQSLDALEILCINCGSTDNSFSIVQEFASRDNRIVVLDNPCGGYDDSLNQGLERATGKYIGIVNHDDYVDTNMFETLARTAILNDAEVVLSNYFEYALGDGGEFVESLIDNLAGCPFYELVIPNNNPQILQIRPVISAGIYKKDFLKNNDVRFTSTLNDTYEDFSFYFKAMLYANRVYLIPDAFLKHYVNKHFYPDESFERTSFIQQEFQEIWEFAKVDADRFEKAKLIIPTSQFDAYWSILNELIPAYQKSFFDELTATFSSFEKLGYLLEENFGVEKWELLTRLLEDPTSFFFENFGPVSPRRSLILNALEIDVLQTVKVCEAISQLIDEETEVFVVSLNSGEIVSKLKEENIQNASNFYSDLYLFESRVTLKPSRVAIRGEVVEILDAGSINLEGKIEHLREEFENEKVSFNKATFVDSVGFVFKSMEEASSQRAGQQRVSFCSNLPFYASDIENFSFEVAADGVTEILQVVKNIAGNNVLGLDGLEEVKPYEPIWNRARKALTLFATSNYSAVKRILLEYSSVEAFCCAPSSLSSKPKISVVVPVYNVSDYIITCVESVLNQAGVNLEVIAVVDGSPDDSLEKLLEIVKTDSRLSVYYQLNLGVSVARNRGIELARGEYIAFIDPDDLYPNRHVLSDLINAARENEALICGGSFSSYEGGRHIAETFPYNESFYFCTQPRKVAFSEMYSDYGWIRFIYHSSLFEDGELRFPFLSFYEDPVFFVNAVKRAGFYYEIPDCVYRYRVRHKPVGISAPKVMDVLEGISHNLNQAKNAENDSLYTTLVNRFERDYCNAIVDSLHYAGVLRKLLQIQSEIDVSLFKPSMDCNTDFWVLNPLRILALKNEETSFNDSDYDAKEEVFCHDAKSHDARELAATRMARKFESSKPYRFVQKCIWKVKGVK